MDRDRPVLGSFFLTGACRTRCVRAPVCSTLRAVVWFPFLFASLPPSRVVSILGFSAHLFLSPPPAPPPISPSPLPLHGSFVFLLSLFVRSILLCATLALVLFYAFVLLSCQRSLRASQLQLSSSTELYIRLHGAGGHLYFYKTHVRGKNMCNILVNYLAMAARETPTVQQTPHANSK